MKRIYLWPVKRQTKFWSDYCVAQPRLIFLYRPMTATICHQYPQPTPSRQSPLRPRCCCRPHRTCSRPLSPILPAAAIPMAVPMAGRARCLGASSVAPNRSCLHPRSRRTACALRKPPHVCSHRYGLWARMLMEGGGRQSSARQQEIE